jgi:hypothetical protein
MTWPMYNSTLCNIYIPLLLWNNKQNQIHLWECYYENMFNHFMVLYLIIYFCVVTIIACFLLFAFVCVCVLSLFESLLGSSVLVFIIIIIVMIIFSLTHFFSVFFSGSLQWHIVSTLSIPLVSLTF